MKFFFKKEKENKEFNSKIILTENVNEELLKISKQYNIPLSLLDFNLISYKTYIKFPGDDFVEASKDLIEKFMIKENLINEEVEIKQIYEIEIKKYKSKKDLELIGEMKVNNNFTYAEYIVSKKSIIYVNDIFNEIKNELNKKKVKNSLLIGIFDLMDDDIKKLQNIIIIDKKLSNDFKIKLCKGLEPVKTKQAKIIYHFKKSKTKKMLLFPVKKDEVLIEIVLPKEGQNGRDCRGKIIKVEKIKEINIPNIEFDTKTIEKKAEDEKIVFIAKKDGYITKDDGKFIIKDEMEIRQINLKTGNVKDADESDVKLHIKEKDVLKEAIMDNMIVETTELYVKGNVGNKAKIKAKKLKIEGQTHQNSKIITNEGELNVHKGEIKGKKIKIKRLEGGKVKAEEVEIDLALGGVVYAKKIKINNLLSHNRLYASEEIKICNQKGEENLLAISPKRVLSDINPQELERKLTEINQFLNIKTKEFNKLKKIYLSIKDTMSDYKKEYLKNKKKGVKTSHVIIKKLKDFKELTDKIDSIKREILLLKNEKENIINTLEYLQSGIYNAKILSDTSWKAFNRIMFELIEPPVKIVYDTKGSESRCGFKLKNEDNLKIIKIKVDDDICDRG